MIPSKMKAIVIEEAGKAVIKELTTPTPKRQEVLLKVERALICTWEQRIFDGRDVPLPFLPGHEISCTVAAIGEDTFTDLEVGQSVVVKVYDHCGECENCRRGADNLCTGKARKRSYDGIPGTGGFAQYFAIGTERVYPLPKNVDVDLDAASFAEPLTCCLQSFRQAEVEMGEDVLVVGGGVMGQLHCQIAKLRGARTILVEVDEKRCETARKNGVDVIINPAKEDAVATILEKTEQRGVHVCFFTVNSLALAEQYLGVLAKRGRIVYYGSFHPKGTIAMDPNNIHYTEKRITGAFSPTVRDFWTASRLLGYGIVDVKPFISERYGMKECQTAIERAKSAETYRVLIDFSDMD